MPELHLYEYAVIRIVPRVEREEFLNAGVILYCRSARFLQAITVPVSERLNACWPGTDTAVLQSYLDAFVRIAAGAPDAGPIAQLEAAARFRWLTAMRSTVIQTSRVHPGRCPQPEQQLQLLLQRYAGPPQPPSVPGMV